MQNSGLDETQAGIKIAMRNIDNLGHAGDTTLMEESKEEEPLDESEQREARKLHLESSPHLLQLKVHMQQ